MNKKSQDSRERLDDKKPSTTREIIKTDPPKPPRTKDIENHIPLVDTEEVDILHLYRLWYLERVDMYANLNNPFFPVPHFRGDIVRYAMEQNWDVPFLIRFIAANEFSRKHESAYSFYIRHLTRITGEDLNWDIFGKDATQVKTPKIIEIKEEVGKAVHIYVDGKLIGEGELSFMKTAKSPETPKDFSQTIDIEGTFSVGTNKPTTNEEL